MCGIFTGNPAYSFSTYSSVAVLSVLMGVVEAIRANQGGDASPTCVHPHRPHSFGRVLGVSDALVGEVGEAVTDGVGFDKAQGFWARGFWVAGLAEEAVTCAHHER